MIWVIWKERDRQVFKDLYWDPSSVWEPLLFSIASWVKRIILFLVFLLSLLDVICGRFFFLRRKTLFFIHETHLLFLLVFYVSLSDVIFNNFSIRSYYKCGCSIIFLNGYDNLSCRWVIWIQSDFSSWIWIPISHDPVWNPTCL